MAEALSRLREKGLTLAVASSKDEPACHMVLENLGIRQYFTVIAGHSDTRPGGTKADIIRFAMERLGLTDRDREAILMVGDRKYDVLGAAKCGIRCLGVDFCGFARGGGAGGGRRHLPGRTADEMADYILARAAQ